MVVWLISAVITKGLEARPCLWNNIRPILVSKDIDELNDPLLQGRVAFARSVLFGSHHVGVYKLQNMGPRHG